VTTSTRYLEIAERLAAELVGCPPGTRVASEPELAGRFGVGRAAARSALQELERRLLVRRIQGAGTFVNRRIDYVISRNRSPSWHATVAAAGATPRSQVKSVEQAPLPAERAAQLDLLPGIAAHRIVRNFFIDDLLAYFLALKGVTGIDEVILSKMVGRQLPFFSLLVPFWVVWAMSGFRGMLGVWPAALTAGICFAVPQFLVSNLHGPWLVDIVASLCSMAGLATLLRFWRPRQISETADAPAGESQRNDGATSSLPAPGASRREFQKAWLPWILLSVMVFIWGIPRFKTVLNGISSFEFTIPNLHNVVMRAPPVAPPGAPPEKAIFTLNWLSATGSGILVAAMLSGLVMGFGVKQLGQRYLKTVHLVRFSLLTIAAMLALGYVTRYSGTDATLGLALAKTGALYPFFGTLLGWLGVALTGSDTASNVLFGSLQKITAERTHVSPILMAAANSSGGVMGKMVDAQSIVVASTATNWYGHEGDILRYVFFHSIALACLVGILVYLQAYVAPFTSLVVK